MRNGWDYLKQFNTGVVAAVGKKASIKHVLAQLQHEPESNVLTCTLNGITNRAAARDLNGDSEFTVRIKCADKRSRLYLTAKGKAKVSAIGRDTGGIFMTLRVFITGIAAYRKGKDETNSPVLRPLYNDMTTAEDRKAKMINNYFAPSVRIAGNRQ